MDIQLKVPGKGTVTFDKITYDPAHTSLDAYVMRLQTWPLFFKGKWYRAGRSHWDTDDNQRVVFQIEMEEE